MHRTWFRLCFTLALVGCSSLLGLDDDDDDAHGSSSGSDGGRSSSSGSAPSTASSSGGASSASGGSSTSSSSGGPSSSSGGSSSGNPPDAGPTIAADPSVPLWRPLPDSPPAANYQLTADTVLDHTTQLVWERVPPTATETSVAAHDRCAALALAAQDDWRLPTRIELLSILDYARTPLLNPDVFAGLTPADQYWTQTHPLFQANTANNYFYVDTHSGAVETSVNDTNGTQLLRSRCVRAGITTQPETRFTTTADTVYDANTGLTWWRGDSAGDVTYTAAQQACDESVLAGATDWRLPTAAEQHSIVDDHQTSVPLWDPAVFAASGNATSWSSTHGLNTERYVVNYVNGSTLTRHTDSDVAAVRCVR